jgi:hypothetical protein
MILNFLKGFVVDGKRKQTNFEEKIKKGIKLHTIRRDEKGRWKKGNKIHFSTGSRTNNYNCFKEGKCTGIQKVEIRNRSVYIEGRELSLTTDKIEWLAINDGFDCIGDFWAWFDQYSPFFGKLIHWTELRY